MSLKLYLKPNENSRAYRDSAVVKVDFCNFPGGEVTGSVDISLFYESGVADGGPLFKHLAGGGEAEVELVWPEAAETAARATADAVCSGDCEWCPAYYDALGDEAAKAGKENGTR